MSAKVIKMEGATQPKKERARKFSFYSEDPQAQYLLMGTDERGRTVYFFKMQITGLHDRVFGPYDSRSLAIDGFDTVLGGALESFCNVHNVGRDKSNNGMEHIAVPEHLTPVPMR
jgi:hypothetical protein